MAKPVLEKNKDNGGNSTEKIKEEDDRYEMPKLQRLSDENKYKSIKQEFKKGMEKQLTKLQRKNLRLQVESIEEIEHEYLRRRFEMKQYFLEDNGKPPNIKKLWHGCTARYAKTIDHRGFHKLCFNKPSKTKPGTIIENEDLGEDMVFSVDVYDRTLRQTIDNSGIKRFMYQADVITGNPKEADTSTNLNLQLPDLTNTYQSLVMRHPKTTGATEYMIECIDQALPRYKITYIITES